MKPRDLSNYAEYRAGRGVEEVARERGQDPADLVKLSSNENPLGPSPAAIEAIRGAANRANRYPRTSHVDLVAALADRWTVAPEQVWLANGGDGALDYIARAVLDPGDPVLVPEPGFAYYGMSARYHHGRIRTYPVEMERDFAMTAEGILSAYDGERIVYLTSPHNPTGARVSLPDIERIAEETAEETLVLVDEAYAEFADAPSAVTLLERGAATDDDGGSGRDDVAVLRTFSKAHGLAGLRLGYALVPASWADAYARVNTPFAASEIACRAGLAALEDEEHVERSVDLAAWGREYTIDTLDARTWESAANFVLADVGDASSVTARLEERGVIVRDCTSFGLPSCVRITCGTREGTKRAVRELNDVL